MADSTIPVSKLQTAERQLDTAIWLWFHNGDIVSIIQLVDAAIGVIDDLLFHHQKLRPIPFTPWLIEAAGKTPREVRPKITGAADFAKHARNDPEGTYEYEPEFAEHYIFCTILARDKLVGDGFVDTHNELRGIFALWYGLAHFETFDTRLSSYQRARQSLLDRGFEKLSRIDFLKKAGGDRFVGNPPSPDTGLSHDERPPAL